MRVLARGGRRFRLRGRVVGRLAGFGRVSDRLHFGDDLELLNICDVLVILVDAVIDGDVCGGGVGEIQYSPVRPVRLRDGKYH